MIILTSGIEDFGFGFSEEEAILDAVQNASRQIIDEDGAPSWTDVTYGWIVEQLAREPVVGKYLYFAEEEE